MIIHSVNACDELNYQSIVSVKDSTLTMYQYSADVIATNINSIDCKGNQQYITYTANSTISSLQSEINEKYILSNGNPPCAGVTQTCGNQTCNMEYSVKLPDDTTQITENQCYHMPISNVTDRTCNQCQGMMALND